jgi:PleD family two-component response regulator
LTVSAGVAERREWMSDFGALVQASDDALLSAKLAGRNRVEYALSPASA